MIDAGEWRRAAVLAGQLPRGSRTLRAADPRLAWSETDYLLALAVDNIAFMRYEQGGGKGRKPKQIERPHRRAPARVERTVHGMSAERVGEILARPRT